MDNYLDRPSVAHWITFYSTRSDALETDLARGKPFLWRIVQNLDRRDMPMELVLLPEVESSYNPFARSRHRAVGLWQFIPVTAARFGLRRDWWYDGRRDILRSTNAALDYLQYLHGFFNDNWLLALAAYNAGEGTVQRSISRNTRRGQATDFWNLDLPHETEQYVPKLLALAILVDQPQRYGLNLPDTPDSPQLQVVDLPSQIDFALAAKLAGISIKSLRNLNPGFRRWATGPDGSQRLLLPRRCAAKFKRALAKVPASQRVTWRRHTIRRGETLNSIAADYATTTATVKRINHIRGSLIRSGRTLLIPVLNNATVQAHAVAEASARGGHGDSQSSRPDSAARYTVVRGDSLWSIAQRYSVAVDKLRAWNGLANSAILKPGQTLNVSRTSGGVYYRVEKGDSLYGIAHKYDVSVSNLRRWNDLSKDHYLQPGQKLIIVVDSDGSSGRKQKSI